MRKLFGRKKWQPQLRSIGGLALLVVGLAVGPSLAQWGASGAVFTEDGIEITVHAGVTSTFAMLNALGYDREIDYGPEPLRKPNFSKARQEARDQFGRPGPALKDMKDVVKANQKPARTYLDAALRLGPAPTFKPPQKRTKKLTRKLEKPLRKWYGEEGGASIFRNVVRNSKKDQRALRDPLNALAKKVTAAVPIKSEEDQLLDEESAEKARVIVVLNHLDAHDTLYRLDVNGTQYVVVGPLRTPAATQAARDAAALAHARTLIEKDVAAAALDGTLADGFDKLKKSAKKRVKTKANFVSEHIACALLRHVDPKAQCSGTLLPKAALESEAMTAITAGVKTWQANKTLLREELSVMLGGTRTPVEEKPPVGTAANPKPAPAKKPAPQKPAPTPAKTPAPAKKPAG